MTVDAWLKANAFGYADLSDEETEAIRDFSLLWSFFEGTSLRGSASANKIQALVDHWEGLGLLDAADFLNELEYFRNRYEVGGALNASFDMLNLRQRDMPGLVSDVISRKLDAPNATVVSLLIVIYRLRNNLFHGQKWAYGIKGQLSNFRHAISVLMTALSRPPLP
ncbi:hypothetical protein [Uliginosibacterium sp. H1]|uniref:hypothetical protein n=1 Tax=Uliginosibacterium sp. H1 TaxID=3114757 RepID=UPI002E183A24|nr:hypothetical protein [Uliginosibacterium sp. H1]